MCSLVGLSVQFVIAIYVKNKTKIIILLIVVTTSLFTINIFAKEYTSRHKAPENVMEVINSKKNFIFNQLYTWSKEEGKAIDITDLSIDEKQYQLHYIKIDDNKTYSNINQMMEISDKWLVLINLKGEPYKYAVVSKNKGKYELASLGGNAEFFRKAETNISESVLNKMRLFFLSGKYYFVNQKNQVMEIPDNNEEVEKYGNIHFKTLNGDDCMNLILEGHKKRKNMDSRDFKYGTNPGLTEILNNIEP